MDGETVLYIWQPKKERNEMPVIKASCKLLIVHLLILFKGKNY